MTLSVKDRYKQWDRPHCWQYDIKINTRENLDIPDKELASLKTGNFKFSFVDKKNKENCRRVTDFIHTYEWLGKMPVWVTHRFIAEYKDNLGGVVVMATPNAFSKMLGENTKDVEKLIARGASAGWTPKNMASWQIMQSIRYMVKNTQFKLFIAYSDPLAKELGTVYQACNFYYLGQNYGGGNVYFDPNNPDVGWVGSYYFNYRSAYVRYAKELGIEWLPEWYTAKRKINRKTIPADILDRLKQVAKDKMAQCETIKTPKKHKYAYILGRDKRETKTLRKKFEEINADKIQNYPKIR